MQIVCNIDRVAALRAGIDAQNETIILDVDPTTLSEEDRALLAGRLNKDLEVCHRSPRDGTYHDGYRDGYSAPLRYYRRDLWPDRRPPMVVATAPTLDAVLQAIRDEDVAWATTRAERAAKQAERDRQRREATQAVLTARKTRDGQKRVGVSRGNDGSLTYDIGPVGSWAHGGDVLTRPYPMPDWPCDADHDVIASPEAQAWIAECAQAREQAIEDGKRQALAELEAKEEYALRQASDEQAARTEKLCWIAEHGSDRLKRLVAEGIEHDNVYYEERLIAERPGWDYAYGVPGEARETRNTRQEGLDLLDKARKTDPNAKLVWWVIEHEHNDCDTEEDCPAYDWRGYVCVGEFLGNEVVYGLPYQYSHDC